MRGQPCAKHDERLKNGKCAVCNRLRQRKYASSVKGKVRRRAAQYRYRLRNLESEKQKSLGRYYADRDRRIAGMKEYRRRNRGLWWQREAEERSA